ncbi:hypothetical protein [Sphaerisporangium corydalis]|uniref:DUF4352 domain-containing protein n=1 Tax=Sphaerisporangium corydalis TaxID=1441875 RepID=A0ABV9ERF4_9ACTN|nr:hypothetical protein [Sphaerisporangium corydalis]
MTSTPSGGRPRRRPVLIPVLVVLAAATVGVSAAAGGLKEAPEKPPEQAGKGAEIDQGRMVTRFDDAVVRLGGKDGIGVSDRRYLQLVLKVTNKSEITLLAQMMDDALVGVRADGKPLDDPASTNVTGGPRVVAVSGGHSYGQMHPGVPATVVLAYELPEGKPPPKSVQIDAGMYAWAESFFYKTHEWRLVTTPVAPTAEDRAHGRQFHYSPIVVAQVTLPVRVEA